MLAAAIEPALHQPGCVPPLQELPALEDMLGKFHLDPEVAFAYHRPVLRRVLPVAPPEKSGGMEVDEDDGAAKVRAQEWNCEGMSAWTQGAPLPDEVRRESAFTRGRHPSYSEST